MSEIILRGKRVDNGEWVEGHTVLISSSDADGAYIISSGTEFDMLVDECGNIGEMQGIILRIIPETLGQYSGLNDKNGKKIFDGDILKIYEGSEDNEYKICELYSYRGVLCVDYETSEWDFNALAFLDSDNVFSFEVIGNIHDNPDLLEVR